MKKEVGWCKHVRGYGFFRPGGSSATAFECEEPIVCYWPTANLMLVYCHTCYKIENPLAIGFQANAPQVSDTQQHPSS